MILPATFEITGFNFHTYGLIIGISIIVAISLIEKKLKKLSYSESVIWKLELMILFFGTIFARAWHVITDFYLYKNNLIEIFYIWNGGLGILGGVIGGVIGVKAATLIFTECKKVKILEVLDVAVFGLPFAQAIGRLGNYINQELYGAPTNFFMKLFIDSGHRLSGFENIEYYHPLFFYEMILMFIFGLSIYYLDNRKKLFKIGTGKLFITYILYYSIIRFLLDFIRLDKNLVGGGLLSQNQIFLLFLAVFSIIFLRKKSYE